MKDIPKWLAERLSKLRKPVENDQQNDAESIDPDDEDEIESSRGAKLADSMDNHSAEKNVVMPDIYSEGHDATVPHLTVLDLDVTDLDESTGFNPYDTGILQKK